MALSFCVSGNSCSSSLSRTYGMRDDPRGSSIFIASLDTAHALVVSDCLRDLPGDSPMYKRYIAHLDDAFFARLDNEAHNIFTRNLIIAQLREILLSRESSSRSCSYTIEKVRDARESSRACDVSGFARCARIPDSDVVINVTFRAMTEIRHYEIIDQITIECVAFLSGAEISSGIQSLRQCVMNAPMIENAHTIDSQIRKIIDRIALVDQITPLR